MIAEDRQAGVIAGVVDVRFRRGDPDIQEILDTGGSGYFEIANLAVLPDYR